MTKGQKDFYCKFRFDLLEDEHPYQVISLIIDGAKYYPGVLGVETHNKYGEVIKKHIHYHFVADVCAGTLRKRLERNYPKFQERKGSSYYSLSDEKDVKDTDHFFRYCIKQYEPIEFKYEFDRIPIPPNFDMTTQQLVAHEQYNIGKEIICKKREKRDTNLSVYEKIIDKVTNDSPDLKTLTEIKLYVLDYFIENSLPPNKLKICDIASGIAILLRVITREEFLGIL